MAGYRPGPGRRAREQAAGPHERGHRDGGHRGGGHRSGGRPWDGYGYREGEGRGGYPEPDGYRGWDRPGGPAARDDWDRPGRPAGRGGWDGPLQPGGRGNWEWPGETDLHRPERHREAAGYRRAGQPRRRDPTGGAEGNERLTAITGALLLVLLAVEGFTILSIHQLLTLHFFVGMLLVGPVLLKACSTVYRFTRYYSGVPAYRRKGPPAPLLRLLGPFVLLLSLAVVGSGVMLAFTGPAGQIWLLAHKASFVLWFLAMSVHVLAYMWRLPRLISGDLATRAGARAQEVLAGRSARWLMVTASVLAGLLLAVITYHLAGQWTGFAGG